MKQIISRIYWWFWCQNHFNINERRFVSKRSIIRHWPSFGVFRHVGFYRWSLGWFEFWIKVKRKEDML